MCKLLYVNEKQHALGVEIRAEMLEQGISQVEMIRRIPELKPASFRNWFVTAKNPVSYPMVVAVCDELGVEVSEMSRRAEERMARRAQPPATQSEYYASQAGPEAQAGIAEGKRQARAKSRKRQGNH